MGLFSTSKRLALLVLLVGLATPGLIARRQVAPDPPTIGVAVAYSRATVNFTAPADDGGATITSYTATSSPGGIVVNRPIPLDGSIGPIHVTGLTAGQAYTFTVTATNSAGTSSASAASNSVTPDALLVPDDYSTNYDEAGAGEIPARLTPCTTIEAATYGNGTLEASAGIQAALNACTAGQHVKLGSGVFRTDDDVSIPSNVTLRGSGWYKDGGTILYKSNSIGRAPPLPATEAETIVTIGNGATTQDSTAVSLTVDGDKGDTSVTVTDATGFAAGQIVKIDADEWSSMEWINMPPRFIGTALTTTRNDRLWHAVKCVPGQDIAPTPVTDGLEDCPAGILVSDRPFPNRQGSASIPGSLAWHSRAGRFTAEVKEIASVVSDGAGGAPDVITFNSPLHIDYPTSKTSQVVRYVTALPFVRNAGLEDLTMVGGSAGDYQIKGAAFSWVKNVEATHFGGPNEILNSYRITIRDSWIHNNHHPFIGGGGYLMGYQQGSSEMLIENNIVMYGNKQLVARAGGGGNVVAYNWFENAYIGNAPGWQEVGLSSSHWVGSHHVLFEGNLSFNYDQDATWGSSNYNIVLRNHLTGNLRDYPDTGNPRVVGLGYGVFWNAFFGNVLGESTMTATIYEDPGDRTYGNASSAWGLTQLAVWRLGYNGGTNASVGPDPRTRETVMRDGNFDYVTDSVLYDRTAASTVIPDSLYLSEAPDFFDGYTWPWVDAEGATKLYTLPAFVRGEALLAGRTAPPYPPIINSVVRTGSLQVTVYFSPPYYNGGDVLDNYTVTIEPGGHVITRSGVVVKNEAISVPGLSLNTEYVARITAANSFGTSPVSVASEPFTLDGEELPTSDIQRVQFAYGANVGVAVNPQTAVFADDVTEGNLVVVIARTTVSPPNGLMNVTGTNGTFTAHLLPGGSGPQLSIHSAIATATGPYTASCNFNTVSTTQFCFAIEYEPGAGAVWSNDPGDRYRYHADSDGTATFTSNIATPTIATISGGVLVMVATQAPAATYTAGPGFTLITGTINSGGSNFGGVQEMIADEPIAAFSAEMESTSVVSGRYMYGFFNTTPDDSVPVTAPKRLRLRVRNNTGQAPQVPQQ
jgi:hypothetical protein